MVAKLLKSTWKIAIAVVSGVVAISCSGETGTLTALEAQDILEHAYPMSHTTGEHGPNRVIAVLQPGSSAKIQGTVDEKDYRSYEVRLTDGRTGYIIYDPAIELEWD